MKSAFRGEQAKAVLLQCPTLTDKELIKDCRHCPPTTDAFRRWLSERISAFLLAN
ncbi:hypothetical protein [Archangium sp.]|uniref:hypothetical protein n=1 Tax=Archangium sp. TaxID=1872627 RepID=UPI002D649B86|nr:hypothetical protein [Archangium sp.]HYO59795.1 hypothetical protein [Archangium sp.]